MIVDGWFSWADRSVPGAPNKIYLAPNAMKGIVCHSAEGWLPYLLADVADPGSNHSWTGSIALDGTLYQHYPVTASIWASGSRTANINYIAFEAEGVQPAKLTKPQEDTCLRMFSDFQVFTGIQLVRQVSLWEHNEVATMWSPNAGPTSCPSNRYDNVFARLGEIGVDDMTKEELEKILRDEYTIEKNTIPSITKRFGGISKATNLSEVPK